MEFTTNADAIRESKCFGIAWDGTVRECKKCEAAPKCKIKTLGGEDKDVSNKKVKEESTETTMKPVVPRPEPKVEPEKEVEKEVATTKEVEKKEPAKKPRQTKPKEEKTYSDDMPIFKNMDLDVMLKLAEDRGIDLAEFDKYANSKIKKMRVTMALKKTYEVK